MHHPSLLVQSLCAEQCCLAAEACECRRCLCRDFCSCAAAQTPTTVLNRCRCTPQRVRAAVDGEEKQERDMEGVGGGQRQVSQGMQEEIERRGLVEVEKVRVKENNNEEELHLFYHHLPPLSLSDKLVLLVAGIFLVPIRSSLLCHGIHFTHYFQTFSGGIGDAVCLACEWLGFDVQGPGSL